MNSFLQEVGTQGEVLKACLDRYFNERNVELEMLKKSFDEGKFKRILFVGMGSSFYAPYSVVDYLTNKGIPSVVLNAYEVSRYQMGQISKDTLVVAISQSGKSKEVVELIDKAKKITTVVGIVNKEDSILAKEADIKLFIHAGTEKHISNKSYLCTLAVLNIFAAFIVGELNKELIKQFYDIAEWIKNYLDNMQKNTQPVFDFSSGSTSYDFIANGPSMSTASQAGLIYREGPHVTTSAINCADYAHGWDRSVKTGYTGIMLDPYYKEDSVEKRMVNTIIEKGGKVILITSEDIESSTSLMVIKLPKVEERLVPMLQMIPCDTLMGWMLGE